MTQVFPRLLAASLLLSALPALAQTAGQPAPARRAPAAQSPVAEAAGITTAQVRAATDLHLTAMRGRLKITPAQVPQWDVFTTVSRENAEEMHERFDRRRAGLARFDAAQNMADFAQISELHARQLVRLSASFQALYATMSADQQRETDAYFREVRSPERPARPARRAAP